MNIAIVGKLLKLFFRAVNVAVGLLLLSLSLSHIFSAGSSLLATGVPFLGFWTLPPLPTWFAFIVGLLILPKALLITVAALLPKRIYRQISLMEE